MNLLVKFSGEFFSSKNELIEEGVSFLKSLVHNGITSGYIVVGGGNRIRGKNSFMSRNISDKLGVISTIFNAYVLHEYFTAFNIKSLIFSHYNDFGLKYSPEIAMNAFNDENWVILASGLGTVGYISTDLSSVIKSLELNVDAMVKITKVDGLFDKNPSEEGANIIKHISYNEVIDKKLEIIDLSAIAIASENKLPIGICSLKNFSYFIKGGNQGSIIGYDWR